MAGLFAHARWMMLALVLAFATAVAVPAGAQQRNREVRSIQPQAR